jgi:hypothetical protein
MPARRVFANNLTSRLKTGPEPTVEELMNHPDCWNTFRNMATELHDYLMNGRHLREMARLALHRPAGHPPAEPLPDSFWKLSALATTYLAAPVSGFATAILTHPDTVSELRGFLDSGDDAANPVFVGHFQAILVAAERNDADVIKNHFPNLLRHITQRLHMLGFQELLAVLLSDWPDLFVVRAKIVSLGDFCVDFSDTFRVGEDCDLNGRRLLGFFSALSNILHELNAPALPAQDAAPVLPPALFHPRFIRALVEAALTDVRRLPAVFRTGVDVISRILADLEISPENPDPSQESGVFRYLAEASRSFWAQCRGGEQNWHVDEWNDDQKLILTAFPLFWQYQIEHVYPAFFHKMLFSSAFGRTMLYRLTKMPPPRLADFILRHDIIGILEAKKPIRQIIGTESGPSYNPFVPRFVDHIAHRGAGIKVNDGDREKWDKLSVFIVEWLLPYQDQLNQEE